MEKLKELIKIIGPNNFITLLFLIIISGTFLFYNQHQNEFIISMTKLGYTNCGSGTFTSIWLKDCNEYYRIQKEQK